MPWKLDTESEAPSATSFKSGWHNLIELPELINEELHTVDGPPLRGRSDEHFWHLKRYNTAATRISAMHCAAAIRADRGSRQTGREELREYSQDHGAGDRCGESVGILYLSAAENTGQDLAREKPFLSP